MNILLTSVGRRTYMVEYFKEALKGQGKVYVSNSVKTYTMEHADGFLVSPLIYDSNYIDVLIQYCKENEIAAIVPLFDIDIPVLARNRELFRQAGVKLIVASTEVADKCNDKWLTYCGLKDMGLAQPETFISREEAKVQLAQNNIHFPLILKPRWGCGSIGIMEACNETEMDVLYQKLYKEIFDSYLKYESNADQANCIVIQQKIDGQEYGLDVFNDLNGCLATVVAKKKIAMRAGETDVAEIVAREPFMGVATILSEKLHHVGNLDVDVFLAPDNRIFVLEMNARFGGQYPFSHLAGVNFPKQIVKWLRGEGNDSSLLNAEVGVRSCKDLLPVRLN